MYVCLHLGQPPANPTTDTQALNLLFSTLASGTYASEAVIAPLPQHIALAGTFLVHPSTTTRAKSAEQKEAAHVALRLLRLISTLITPKDARLDTAFCFRHTQTSRSGRLLHADEDSSPDLPHDKTDWRRLDVANESSLWSRAEDFWHAVGWAFNCSVLHSERWEHWQIWLRFMCDILLDDWNVREQAYEEFQEKKQKDAQEPTRQEQPKGKGVRSKKNDDLDIFRESMLFRYIDGRRHGQNRRIIRAIFADGSTTSVNGFRQVFPKELKHSKSKAPPEKAKKRDREVNIEQEEYGDYLSQDESDEEGNETTDPSMSNSRSSSPPADSKFRRTKRTRRGTRSAADPTAAEPVRDSADASQTTLTHHGGGVSTMGGLESLGLRKRLLGLLSKVSERIPNDFVHFSELYYLFVENIRPLPLPIFQTFVSPYVLPELPDEQQTTLCQALLLFMLESGAPNMHDEDLNQDNMEKCFLPFAASTTSVVDNVKVSIILEASIILLANSNMLTPTPSFKEAVESGILRRAERAQDDMRRSAASRNMESQEWCWLVESGERLMFLVELLALRPSQQASQD